MSLAASTAVPSLHLWGTLSRSFCTLTTVDVTTTTIVDYYDNYNFKIGLVLKLLVVLLRRINVS